MTPDLEAQLRRQLRDAAASAPTQLGVDDPTVLARGHRVVQRRRALTTVGAAAVAAAVAVTVGVLAPRPDDTDTLPSLPSPSVTTPRPAPTGSGSPTPTSTPTSSPTSSPTSTPTRSAAPPSTPTARPSGAGWSPPVSVAGTTYRARFVPSSGGANHDLELTADGAMVFRSTAVYNSEGRWQVDVGDPRRVYYLGGTRLIDLVSVGGRPVGDEVIGHVPVPTPEGTDLTGSPYMDLVVTVFRTVEDNPRAGSTPKGWVVRFADGGLWDIARS